MGSPVVIALSVVVLALTGAACGGSTESHHGISFDANGWTVHDQQPTIGANWYMVVTNGDDRSNLVSMVDYAAPAPRNLTAAELREVSPAMIERAARDSDQLTTQPMLTKVGTGTGAKIEWDNGSHHVIYYWIGLGDSVLQISCQYGDEGSGRDTCSKIVSSLKKS